MKNINTYHLIIQSLLLALALMMARIQKMARSMRTDHEKQFNNWFEGIILHGKRKFFRQKKLKCNNQIAFFDLR